MGPPVITGGYGPKSLLPRCVPYLQLNLLVFVIKEFAFAINPNCGLILLLLLIQGGVHQKRGLPTVRVTDDYNLKKEVVVCPLRSWGSLSQVYLIIRLFLHFEAIIV